MGLSGETMHTGRAGDLSRAATALTTTGAVLTATLSRRSRLASAIAGTALLAGSACTRFAIFEAGQASARDPRYTIIPQRQRAGQPSAGTVSDPVAPSP